MQDIRVRLLIGLSLIVAVLIVIVSLKDIPSPNLNSNQAINPPQSIDVSDELPDVIDSDVPAGIDLDAYTFDAQDTIQIVTGVDELEFLRIRSGVVARQEFEFSSRSVKLTVSFDLASEFSSVVVSIDGEKHVFPNSSTSEGPGIGSLSKIVLLKDLKSHALQVQVEGNRYIDLFSIQLSPV